MWALHTCHRFRPFMLLSSRGLVCIGGFCIPLARGSACHAGGAHWPMNPSGSIQGSMRFSGMVPIDHGRVPAGPAMQRPKSASPSDVAPSLMGQMHSGAAHPMQQFRRLNPVQQGMIPTGLQGHTAPEPMSLHRINSSGDLCIAFSIGCGRYLTLHLFLATQVILQCGRQDKFTLK